MPPSNETSPQQPLEELQEMLCRSVRDLSAVDTQLRPRSKSAAWSIQQIVGHLLLTYSSTGDILRERRSKGTPTKKPVTLKQKLMQFGVVQMGYFPRGRKAPLMVQPESNVEPHSGAELASTIESDIASLSKLIDACEQTLGRGRAVTHAVMGPMSMQQWRKFQLVHGRHHVRQILAIRAEYGL